MLKLNIQLFAHKKGMGSTRNGRDSESKRLGAKRADGQGRLMLLDYYTYGNVKATATEEGMKVTMDFDMEEREVMSFAY